MEHKFVKGLPERFVCPVCKKLLNKPHATNCCGEHICLACIEQWIEKQGKEQCPLCHRENLQHMIYLPMKREINKLEVYCPNQSQGCEETMKLEELQSHLATNNPNGCGYVSIECPNKDCSESLLRKDLAHHYKSTCEKRKVLCKHCSKEGPYYFMVKWHMRECPGYPVHCPKNCGTTRSLRRKDLEKHKNVCPLESVPCPYQEVGCSEEMLRKEFTSHLESSTKRHLDLAYTAYKNLKVSEQSLKLTIGTQIEHTRKTVPEAAATLERLTKILCGVFQMEQEEDSLKFRFPSDFKSPVSPSFQICNNMVMYLAVNAAGTQGNKNSTLSLLLLQGELDGQFEIHVEETCEQRTEKPLVQHRGSYKESDSNIKLCGRCSNPQGQTLREGREIGRVPLPPDFEGGYYKYCVVTLTLKAHSCSHKSM